MYRTCIQYSAPRENSVGHINEAFRSQIYLFKQPPNIVYIFMCESLLNVNGRELLVYLGKVHFSRSSDPFIDFRKS